MTTNHEGHKMTQPESITGRLRLIRHAKRKALQACELERVQLEAEVAALDAAIEHLSEIKEQG